MLHQYQAEFTNIDILSKFTIRSKSQNDISKLKTLKKHTPLEVPWGKN